MMGMEDAEVMQGMETAYGFRIDRDLIEPLGGSISYSLPKLRSLLSAPNLMAVASLDDREAFVRGMDGLMEMMEAAGEADSGWSSIRNKWNSKCSYTNTANGKYALCNTPSNSHSWQRPSSKYKRF